MQLTDRRGVPEAAGLPERLRFKTADQATGQMLALDDAEGIVTAIVSVTGTVDEVDDVIVPGAYRETLVKRRPKVCWAHSWEHPIGRVLYIEELMPGDDRLPSQTKDGSPWPREAGALVATMQFNMRTDEGKNAFEAVRFYSETGECEYSIGYQVPAGKSTRDGKGIRFIKALDLYELSVVLFGAHTMTGTLSIKQAIAAALERKTQRGSTGSVARLRGRSAKSVLAGLQTKAPGVPVTDAATVPAAPEEKPEEPGKPAEDPDADKVPDHSDGVMVALYPDPAAADALFAAISGPDNVTPREDLHVTLAYLGKVTDTGTPTADEIVRRVTDAVQGERKLTGTIGGVGQFPPSESSDDQDVTWVPVDVPGLGLLRETVADALGDAVATDHGFTPHITVGYGIGLIDPVKPIDVTFDAVHVVYGDQKRSITLNGIPLDEEEGEEKAMYADLGSLPLSEVVRLTAIESLTHEVKAEGGTDRNRGDAEKLRRYWTVGQGGAEIAWNTPGDFTRCVKLLSEHMTPERAKGYCANRHKEMTGMWPGDRDNKGYDPTLEVKADVATETKGPGDAIPAAPSGAKGYPRLPGSFEERQDAIQRAVYEALRGDMTGDDDGHERYEWDHVGIDATFEDRAIATRYKWDGTEARQTFEVEYRFDGDMVEVLDVTEVELQVVAVDVDGRENTNHLPGDLMPLAEDVAMVAAAFKSAHAAAIETKAGRVLSGRNERVLREAVENLVNVLAAAGVRIRLSEVETDDDEPTPTSEKPTRSGDVRKEPDPDVDLGTTSPSASVKALDDGRLVLDAKDLDAALAALTDGV